MLPPIQMLWIGPRLSALERLSVASFLAHGHAVHLYSYAEIEGVPAGTTCRDAREVLPESEVFTYAAGFGRGSPSAFANYFRYQLLLERGGLWCDVDIVCLKPFDFALDQPYCIASQKRNPGTAPRRRRIKLNACLLQAPAGSAVMRECRDVCAATDKAVVRWGQTGPELMTRKFAEHGLAKHVLDPDTICPVDWWKARDLMTLPLPDLPRSYAIHFWNEVWRHHGLDKDASYPPDCAFEILKKRYCLRG